MSIFKKQKVESFGIDVEDERKVNLRDIISSPKDNFVYEYDPGDGWEHKIVLEKILPLNFSRSPVVIKGKKFFKKIAKIGIGGEAVSLGRFDQREEDGTRLGFLWGIGNQPIPAEDKWANDVFGNVIQSLIGKPLGAFLFSTGFLTAFVHFHKFMPGMRQTAHVDYVRMTG